MDGKGNCAVYALQEPIAAYSSDFGGKIEAIRAENWVFEDEYGYI